MQYRYLCLSPDRLVQMATVLGEKVRIEKGRQNDNEEGKLKTQGHKMFHKVGRKEVRTIKKHIPERNSGSEK